MNWSSEWLLQENPQLSNQSRLPFLLMRHECLLLVEAKMPNVFDKSLWGRCATTKQGMKGRFSYRKERGAFKQERWRAGEVPFPILS